MNGKIKELALQAQNNGDSIHYYDPVFAEKFAKLIVQECVDIISSYTVRMNKPGESYLHPIQGIKQHFGVEE